MLILCFNRTTFKKQIKLMFINKNAFIGGLENGRDGIIDM